MSLFSRFFAAPPQTKLDIFRQITKGATPLVRVIYATADREQVHIWTDSDAQVLELQEQGAHVLQMRSGQR